MVNKKRIILLFVIICLFFVLTSLSFSVSDKKNISTLTDENTSITYNHRIEKPAYKAYFKTNPQDDDYLVAFSAWNRTLKIKPNYMGFNQRPSRKPSPSTETSLSTNLVTYKNIFGKGVTIEYASLDDKLKESIIFLHKEDLPSIFYSSEDLTIDFVLDYPKDAIPSIDGENEWDGKTITTDREIVFKREKKPHTIYLINEFYKILKPKAFDRFGNEKNLTYTLYKVGEETHLTLNAPYEWLKDANYPITLDPTIEFNTSDAAEWKNHQNCGSLPGHCTGIYVPGWNNAGFAIGKNCLYGTEPVEKLLFQFDISDLYGYDGDLIYAKIKNDGACYNKGELEAWQKVYLMEIAPFNDAPECGDYPDNETLDSYVRFVMNKTFCPGMTLEYTDITSNLEDALENDSEYISFKYDVEPFNDIGEGNPPSKINYHTFEDILEIQYAFSCSLDNDCLSDEFCNASSMCQAVIPNNNYPDIQVSESSLFFDV